MQKKLLIIAYVWPEPNSTAAGNRMLQLIHFFLEQKYEITVACTAAESDLAVDLDAIGVKKAAIQLNHSSFDDFITGLNPEIVLFDRFLTEEQFGWRVAEFAPNALRILDTEDLHSLRHARHQAFKEHKPFLTETWLQNDMTKREVASIYRCDLSLIISTFEMQLLTEVLKIDKNLLLHLPFMLDKIDKNKSEKWPSFEARKDFICIGNGKHAPNVDAIIWLKNEIWPLIRLELPESDLHIYGAYLPERVQQMHSPNEGFYVHGWAENVEEVMGRARINLAPLRFGAGIKGKLTDAMLYCTPSITTAIGAEGMQADLEWNGEIANTAEAFAHAAINLYQNKKNWQQAQQNGIEIINTLYDKYVLKSVLLSKMGSIAQNLQQHRTRNFIGAMLIHHTLNSTKYMARWIEEKNRGKV